jgi:tRNA-dihydrouridine synthase
MEDVTDVAFREMFARYSKRSGDTRELSDLVLFTEFTPSDGLAFGDAKAQERLRAKLSYTESQRPIVAQIYNSNPQRMEDAARLVQELGFDGVDINMGCPVNAVVKQVSGSALIKYPELAVELIRAVRKGAPELPLSVKTRIGYSSKDDMTPWLTTILKEQPEALTVHLRTRSQFSRVPADWSLMPTIIKLRDELSPQTIMIGNGDIESAEQGKILAQEYGCDGVMVGRGAFGAPDFFNNPDTDREHKIRMLIEHIELFDDMLLKPGHKGYHVMKKHYKAYINGWHGAKELRTELMSTDSPREAMNLLQCALNSV